MPELPEVETVVRGLKKIIVGKKIADFDCDTPKMINYKLPDFKLKIKGLIVKDVARRAKMIIINLSKDLNALVHLKMTGQLVFSSKKKCMIGGHTIKSGHDCVPNKFTHARFKFSDQSWLYFNDIRKFGWIKLLTDLQLQDYFEKLKLGPEPFSKEFSLDYFKQKIASRPKAIIKQFLHDSKIVVGVGNIYSDEICFYAKVSPFRKLKSLTAKEIGLIYISIKKILEHSIKMQGTTFSNYVNAEGNEGAYSKVLKVYGREGQKCKRCPGIIVRKKIGGRSAHFCPLCQK